MRAATLVCALVAGAGWGLPNVFQVDTGYLSGFQTGSQGQIRGYLGIPYAAPPVGDLRFRPPQRPEPWAALYEAILPGPNCVQPPYPEGSFYEGPEGELSEDCLYLNVWSGAESPDEKRPVMVWIHGGALTRGSGANSLYDGAALAEKGVVVVTLNYRLGVFGYFAHPALSAESEKQSSGNYGVLDQIAALEWVNRNIHLFGGDPERVTIFGESAGSWSVNVLQASPLARGLFHRVIGQSGGQFASVRPLRAGEAEASAELEGIQLGRRLGIEGTGAEAAASLRQTPAQELLAKSLETGAFTTRPNVDGWVLPATVREVFAQGRQADVPVLVGFNADEATPFLSAQPPEPRQFVMGIRARYRDQANEFLEVYGVAEEDDVLGAALDSMRDEWFGWEARTWARLSSTVSSPAYLYYFEHVPPHPEAEKYGAYPAAEIAYVFDNLDQTALEPGEADRRFADRLSDAWVAFARDGRPSVEGVASWPAYDAGGSAGGRHVVLADPVRVEDGLHETALDFYDRFFGFAE